MLPKEQLINQIVRRADRQAGEIYLRRQGPKAIYGGLLWFAKARGYKPGWGSHAFRELYGTWPRARDRGEPLQMPGTKLEEWIYGRKKRPARQFKQQIEELKKRKAAQGQNHAGFKTLSPDGYDGGGESNDALTTGLPKAQRSPNGRSVGKGRMLPAPK
jgi:hypothetical protein